MIQSQNRTSFDDHFGDESPPKLESRVGAFNEVFVAGESREVTSQCVEISFIKQLRERAPADSFRAQSMWPWRLESKLMTFGLTQKQVSRLGALWSFHSRHFQGEGDRER